MAVRAETQVDLNRIDDGSPGAQGTTFIPSVNTDGDISWTNDGGLPNPTTRNIKGPQGPQGPQGPTGPAGPGVTYITLQNGDDLNNCITKGNVYVTASTAVCTSLLNAPTGKPDGELQLEVQWLGSDNYLVQRLTCKNGATRKVYLRTYSSGTFGDWTEEGVPYGTSSTAAGTAAKTASIDNWDRGSNQYVAIKFTNENTASSPTLNINSTGAAQIMTNGSNSAYWEAGSVVNFYWDGTYYQVANTPVYASTVTVGNPNGDNVYIGNSAVQVKQGSSVEAEFKATEASLGGNKAKIKYTEGQAFGQDSHRIVICKATHESGVRNDATLSSRDLDNYDENVDYIAFLNGGHYDNLATIHLWALSPDSHDARIDMFGSNMGGSGSEIGLSADNVYLNATKTTVGDITCNDISAVDIDAVGVDTGLVNSLAYQINGVDMPYIVEKGTKTGGWYYEKWSTGKIEAWGTNIATGTATVTRVSSMLYRAYNINIAIPSGIFDSTPTAAIVTPNYGSAQVAIVSAMAICSSKTALKVQIWKNGNNSDSVNLNFHVVYYPSTY